MKRTVVLFVVLVLLVFLSNYAFADSFPKLINYQGMLTDASGDPVTDGNYDVLFKIWGDSLSTEAGHLKWDHTYTISTNKGLFNVILGTDELIDLPFDVDYWLEIEVGGSTLSPRIRLTSVGYAYRALVADSAAIAGSVAGAGSGWIDDGGKIRLENTNDSVGIGITAPQGKLEISHDGVSHDLVVGATGKIGLGTSTPTSVLTIKNNFVGDEGRRMIKLIPSQGRASISSSVHYLDFLLTDDSDNYLDYLDISARGGSFSGGVYAAYFGTAGSVTAGGISVNGATGYNQFILETSYTPTGTADANGNVGSISWDNNYIYVKTTAGWKRAALSTF